MCRETAHAGYSLEEWPCVTQKQIVELNANNIFSVKDLAALSDGITFNRKPRFLKKFKEDLYLTASFALVGCHALSFLCLSKRKGVRLYVETVSIGGGLHVSFWRTGVIQAA